LALVLAAGTAFAAGGGTSGGATGKGSSESRGGAGPGGGGAGPGGSGSTGSGGGPATNPDYINQDQVPEKPWEVGALWETHRLIRQNDLAGGYAEPAGAYSGSGFKKQFNVLGAYGQYDITEYDRIKLRAYLFEYFISDPGETGFRMDDLILSYTRRVPLPEQFTFRPTFWVTAPTSFASQLQGNITSPRLILDLEKKFGQYVTTSVRTYGDVYINKYRTAGTGTDQGSGGAPNAKYDLRFAAEAEVVMPFHTPLSFGFDAATGYVWYYEPNNTSDQNPQAARNGTVSDGTYATQPILQTYSGEIFARYVLPPLVGVRSDILVALANGDPSLGSVSVLHDGVGHFYMGWRTAAEVYAALTLRY
jgi:hypothetical protein